MNAMDHQGIMGLDITGYGNYGWATTVPVKSLADAKKVKFRTAEAAVNQLLYKQWGLNAVVMPWPDVPVALKQGVIDGLDHTPMVCNITKKFEVAKYYTQINYAQGLFIWIFNKAWFNSLPADLQKTFKEVVHDVCAKIRKETVQQETEQIAKAKEAGIEFISLSDAEMAESGKLGDAVHEKYARRSTSSTRATPTGRPTSWKKFRATWATRPKLDVHRPNRGPTAGPLYLRELIRRRLLL